MDINLNAIKGDQHMLNYGTSRLSLFAATLSLVMAAEASAQLDPQWVQRFDLAFKDTPTGVVVDEAGAIYVTGQTGTGAAADIVTIKYSPDGAKLWVSTYDGPSKGFDGGRAIAIDSAGDLLVLGQSECDFLVIKYDASNGSVIWASQHDGGNCPETPRAFTTEGAGNIYVTGFTWPPGGDHQEDFYTIKMNSVGNVLWTASYDGPGPFLFGDDIAVDIALDSNGDVFVTGPSNATSGTEDYVTIKYRGSDGAQLWLDRYAGAGANDIPVALVIDANDNVYVTGSSFQSGWRYATIKYRNTDGERLWIALDNPGTVDFATSLALDSQGDVYVAGRSDPDGNDGNLNENAVVARHRASDGAQLWMTIYGENGFNQFDLALDITIDVSDNIYVTGQTGSFGASFDLLLLQYDATTGQVVAEGVYDSGPSELASGIAMALDPQQNIVVTGLARNGNTEARDILTLKFPGQTPAIPGDLDGDGQVGASDLLILLANWGPCPPKGDCPADLNDDGSVGAADLLILLSNWG